ncbi:MAG: hypothetical protein ACKPBV_00740, partial [Sphaerospermopsis kisseleviana]
DRQHLQIGDDGRRPVGARQFDAGSVAHRLDPCASLRERVAFLRRVLRPTLSEAGQGLMSRGHFCRC